MKGVLPADLRALIEDHFGSKLVAWQQPDCGLSAAIRLSAKLENNQRVFIKAATDEETAGWLRREYLTLSTVAGDFSRVIEATAALGHIVAPDVLPVLPAFTPVWRKIADDPSFFLSLGLCSEQWFVRAMPLLIDAEMGLVSIGNSLVH